FQEARLGGACKRLALPAHGPALAGSLRGRGGEIQRQYQGGQQNTSHMSPPSLGVFAKLRGGGLRLSPTPSGIAREPGLAAARVPPPRGAAAVSCRVRLTCEDGATQASLVRPDVSFDLDRSVQPFSCLLHSL